MMLTKIKNEMLVEDAAVERRDPTGTSGIRRRFREDLDRRWMALRRLIVEAIAGREDIIGLGPPTVESIRAPLIGGDKVGAFAVWLDEALRTIVLGREGTWTGRYLDEAVALASKRAAQLTVKDAAGYRGSGRVSVTLPEGLKARVEILVAACRVDRTHEVPWLAGRSRDGKVVYIDRRIPVLLPKCRIDTGRSLPWHELGEWVGQNMGLDYDSGPRSAHPIATRLEKEEVGEAWSEYTREMDGYIRAVKSFDVQLVPGDLDLRPYEEGEGGAAILRRLGEKGKAKDAGRRILGANRVRALKTLTQGELRGICEAVKTGMMRELVNGLVADRRPAAIGRRVADKVQVGRVRGHALANYSVVKIFNGTTLDLFRAAGYGAVGTIPERRRRLAGRDAVFDRERALEPEGEEEGEKKLTARPTAREIGRAERGQQRLEEELGEQGVEVLTAGDDAVCFPAGVMVLTSIGDRPIQRIRAGDMVLTRSGFKRVVSVRSRRYDGRLLLITTVASELERVSVPVPSLPMHAAESVGLVRTSTGDGAQLTRPRIHAAGLPQTLIVHAAKALGSMRLAAVWKGAQSWRSKNYAPSLVCTAEHPIWCDGKGFVPAHELVTGDTLQLAGDKLVKIKRIVDLGFGYVDDSPAGICKGLVPVAAWLGVPVGSVDLKRDAVQSKVYHVPSDLQLLKEGNLQLFERLPYLSLDRGLSRESTIAGTRAEASLSRRKHAKRFFTLKTFSVNGRATAFLRAVMTAKTATDVAGFMKERLAAAGTCLLYMLHMRLLAFDRAEAIAVGDRTVDGELKLAANTNFGDRVSSAGLITSARAEQTSFGGWSEGLLTLLAGAGEDLALAQRHTGTGAVSFFAPWMKSLGVALKRLAASATAGSKRHWSWFLCRLLLINHRLSGLQPIVYNLTVEDKPEFYANGILVHNCLICQEISDDGPYDLDTAEGLIPAHLNCRCSYIPAEDKRFASVHEDAGWKGWLDANPYHEPAGSSKGGQFASTPGGGELSDNERSSLKYYVGSGYTAINSYLRKGKEIYQVGLDDIANLDAILGRASLQEAKVVYRGLDSERFDRTFGELKEGDIITDKGFVSTSEDKDVAKAFMMGSKEAGGVAEIHVPKGYKAISVIEALSKGGSGVYEAESEIILNRGSRFKVLSRDKGLVLEAPL
jgi:hypothetical protein